MVVVLELIKSFLNILRQEENESKRWNTPTSRKDGNLASDENTRVEQLGIMMRQCSLASQEKIYHK